MTTVFEPGDAIGVVGVTGAEAGTGAGTAGIGDRTRD